MPMTYGVKGLPRIGPLAALVALTWSYLLDFFSTKIYHASYILLYRLGLACSASGDKEASIEYHQRYLEICKRIGDQLGEGAACAALAHSFKSIGDKKLAIRYLEKSVFSASFCACARV